MSRYYVRDRNWLGWIIATLVFLIIGATYVREILFFLISLFAVAGLGVLGFLVARMLIRHAQDHDHR